MLSNAYFLAKFRFDTAENEPSKLLQNLAKFAEVAPVPGKDERSKLDAQLWELRRQRFSAMVAEARDRMTTRQLPFFGTFKNDEIFGKISLVFGCIGADLCN